MKSLIILLIISTSLISCTKNSGGLQKGLESFQLEQGLRLELIAAEPLVASPVALAFDENRVMYVVENRGYPDPAEGGAPTRLGRIARLTDNNGDGRYDHRTEFAEGFTYPNGVLAWKGGIFITCSPDVFYLKDTDGDGVADIRRVVLTGFSNSKTAQIRMSHPTFGLDGWIYVSGGLNGGAVMSPAHPNRPPVSFSSGDGRFHPETFEFEVTGGTSQYGLAFDTYGRRFGCSNRHPVQHVVFEPWQLNRNPNLLFTETVNNVSRVEQEATVFPISGATTTADFIPDLIGRSHRGTFTAASGLLIFNGTGLTPAHQGNVFICESAQNLIQRQIIRENGVTFRSELPYEQHEFLASTDKWFRPVFLQLGPEGALYLADMHRKVIDHPSYVPEEARGSLDFESGKNDGRIYRIIRENFRENNDGYSPNASASLTQLVQALQSKEEWERATAHRLLLERHDRLSVPMLKRCVVEARSPESSTRALWLLHSLSSLDTEMIKTAIADSHAVVREQAVQLAAPLCERDTGLIRIIAFAASDSSSRVRFATALALGSLQGSHVIPALAKIAAVDGEDRWTRAAVLSGIGERVPDFLDAFRGQLSPDPLALSSVMHDVAQLVGNGNSLKDCELLFHDVISSDRDDGWRISTALGLMEGITGRAGMKSPQKRPLFEILGGNASKSDKHAMDNFIGKVLAVADDENEQTHVRAQATALLAYTSFERTKDVLCRLLDARHPPELQIQAVTALARQGDRRTAGMLTEKSIWLSYTPRVRAAVIAALVSKPEFINVLLEAIKQGLIPLTDIPSVDRRRLIKNEDPEISGRAQAIFKQLEEGDRMQIYEDYRKILRKSADAALGKAVFEKACSACHTYGGSGGKVGPDLTGVHNQPADALLLHILVPNYEVYPAYQAISVETRSGQSLSGRLVAETENSLTLRTSFGTDESILRANIISLTNAGHSLMPDGLELNMTRDELAQLIAYLKSGG